MTNDYVNRMLNELDQTFLELIGEYGDDAEIVPMPMPTVTPLRPAPVGDETANPAEQLQKIAEVTNRISAQRFTPNATIDILLADLIDSILQILSGTDSGDDFFKLLNDERSVKLDDALTDFDFYNDNPYKIKAEKLLAKIEAKKNKR